MCKSEPWGGIVGRKLEASICSWLLLRPVLKAGQQESSIVALWLTRTQSITGEKAVRVGGSSALFCGPWIVTTQQDPDKRNLAFLKKENA